MGRRLLSARRPYRAGARRERRHPRICEEEIALADLRTRRLHDCRLTPDRKLRAQGDALAFLADRRLLTLTQDCSLPSLLAATGEDADDAPRKGFAAPRAKWDLAEHDGVIETKLHRGKTLYLSPDASRAVDPLCRAALESAESGDDDAARLVRYLGSAGPSTVEALKGELGVDATVLRKTRDPLERSGAIVSRAIAVEDAKGNRRVSSVLSRWDQVWRKPWKATEDTALEELVLLGVRAAVVTHEDEVRTWFTWPVERVTLSALLGTGRLVRPASGWLALP